MLKNVTDTVFYVGVDDKDIDLFENQYIVPNGIAYNSYVIMDEKIAIMDMVDAKCADQWFANVAEVLGDRKPDYLIISHLEPDHSANLGDVLAKYPDIKIVSNAKLFGMLPNFFEVPVADRSVTVAEGQTLSLGSHTLQFFMAPMVHWPEVMVTYEQSEKILFSADAFGKFGTLGYRRGLGMRGEKILLQYSRKVWNACTGTSEEGSRTGYPEDMCTPRTNPHRES